MSETNEPRTPNGRTVHDALNETEHLLTETFDQLDPDNDRDNWFIVRITKIREALSDRPAESDALRFVAGERAIEALKKIASLDYKKSATNLAAFNAVTLAKSALAQIPAEETK